MSRKTPVWLRHCQCVMLKSSVSKIGLLVNPKVLVFALPLPEKRMLLAVDTAQQFQAAAKHLKADQGSMNQFV